MHGYSGQNLGLERKKPYGSAADLPDERKTLDEEIIEGGSG